MVWGGASYQGGAGTARARAFLRACVPGPGAYLGQLVQQPLVAILGADQPQALQATQVPQGAPLLLRHRQEGASRQRAVAAQRLWDPGLTGLAPAHQPLVGGFLGPETLA